MTKHKANIGGGIFNILKVSTKLVNLNNTNKQLELFTIRLFGGRVKSKRNRVVPVPLYVRSELVKGPSNHNIFSGGEKAYNNSYFSLAWKRFKRSFPTTDSG